MVFLEVGIVLEALEAALAGVFLGFDVVMVCIG